MMKSSMLSRMLLAAVLASPVAAHAQDYPTRPIKIIVPYAPGGGVDRLARVVSETLREKWGQPVIVENRAGANGNVGAEHVEKAGPDGYTLLYAPPGPLVINKLLYPKLSYDPDTFVPVSVIAMSPNVLTVHPRLNVDSVQQLIVFAKAQPDRLSYASPGSGGTPHLSAELFKMMAGVKIVHVPYKGTGPLLTDLLGGHVDLTFSELGNVLQHVRGGKLHALAVGSAKRNPLLPEVPAMSEVLPGFVSATWSGLVAPAGTPPAIADRLSTVIHDALKQPEAVKRFLETSSLEVIASRPSEMALLMKQERERWGKVIRAIGATVN